MKVWLAELIRSSVMMGRLLRLDYAGAQLYPRDGTTAINSLRVWLVLLPLVVLSSWPQTTELFEKTSLTPFSFACLAMLQTLIAVLAFYLLVWRMAQRIGIEDRFAHYVTVQNWGALPVWLIMAATMWLVRSFAPDIANSEHTEFVLRAFLIYCSFALTTATLGMKMLPTLALCMLELFFGQFVQMVVAYILSLTLRA